MHYVQFLSQQPVVPRIDRAVKKFDFNLERHYHIKLVAGWLKMFNNYLPLSLATSFF